MFDQKFYSPISGYEFVEQYDDGATFVYYLYTSATGVGYVSRIAKASEGTVKYSKIITSIATKLWNFSTHQPRVSDYYYWHNHPNNN